MMTSVRRRISIAAAAMLAVVGLSCAALLGVGANVVPGTATAAPSHAGTRILVPAERNGEGGIVVDAGYAAGQFQPGWYTITSGKSATAIQRGGGGGKGIDPVTNSEVIMPSDRFTIGGQYSDTQVLVLPVGASVKLYSAYGSTFTHIS